MLTANRLRSGLVPSLLLTVLVAALLAPLPSGPVWAAHAPAVAQIVAGPVFTSTPEDGVAYSRGEDIVVSVTYSEPVTVSGKPVVRLAVGERQRLARFVRTEQGGTGLVFRYSVRTRDRDDDGVSISAGELQLKGGSILDGNGNRAALGHPLVPDDPSQKVMGTPPAPEQSTEPTTTTTSPVPDLEQSTEPTTTTTSPVPDLEQSTEPTTTTTPPAPEPEPEPSTEYEKPTKAEKRPRIVAGGVAVISTPAEGDRYGRGEEILVAVIFDAPVIVEGEPQVRVTFEGARRRATFLRSDQDGRRLIFSYTVGPRDGETTVSIAKNELLLAGGSITGRGGAAARLKHAAVSGFEPAPANDLKHAPENDGAGQTQGQMQGSARAKTTGLFIVSQTREYVFSANAGSYGVGEPIQVAVRFDKAVTVKGSPALDLTVGATTRTASYRPQLSKPDKGLLLFEYIVVYGDADDDGVTLVANSLRPGQGGSIRDADDVDADLSHGSDARSDSQVADALIERPVLLGFGPSGQSTYNPRSGADHTVAASGAALTKLPTIISTPANGDTYVEGEKILVEAHFGAEVVVTGWPVMLLRANERAPGPDGRTSYVLMRLVYDSGSGSDKLVFSGAASKTSVDVDGLQVDADSITFPVSPATSIAAKEDAGPVPLGHGRTSPFPNHKVDGRHGVRITGIANYDRLGEATGRRIGEGATVEYKVRLGSAPTGEATVTPTPSAPGMVTATPDKLTFTPDNWRTPQTVKLTMAHDDDVVNTSTMIVTHPVTNYLELKVDRIVAVRIVDDDRPCAAVIVNPEEARVCLDAAPSNKTRTVSTGSVTVDEGGTASFQVRLGARPDRRIRFNVVVKAGDESEVAVSPSRLTFDADNWNTPQTVRVTGSQDDDIVNETATVFVDDDNRRPRNFRHAQVLVDVVDDDTIGAVVSTASIAMREGDSADYTIRLTSAPTRAAHVIPTASNSTIQITSGDGDNVLKFYEHNWNVPRTFTVTAGFDAADAGEEIVISHTVRMMPAPDRHVDVEGPSVTVSVSEQDQQAFELSQNSLRVREGEVIELRVRPATRPTSSFIAVPTGGEGKIETQHVLIFNSYYWQNFQTLRVRALQDDDTNDEMFTLTLTGNAGGSDYHGVIAQLPVTVIDDDG